MMQEIKKAFGLSLVSAKCQAPHGLPFYMIHGRNFYSAKAAGFEFLLIELSASDKFGAAALEKQLAIIMEISGKPAAYLLPHIKKVQRDAMVERNIPFICIPDQMFLPFLGIALSNSFRKEKMISAEKMTPAAQVLFLYFLYRAHGMPVIKKQAAEDLKLTRMTITRASEQLLSMQLIRQEKHGKEQWMTAATSGMDYYEMARPYLINPVQRTITAAVTGQLHTLPAAGESALSLHSMLNDPTIPTVAADKKSALFDSIEEIDTRWEPEKKAIHVQAWHYDPVLFSKDGSVDPVSLAASLQDVHDERAEGELRDFLEKYEW